MTSVQARATRRPPSGQRPWCTSSARGHHCKSDFRSNVCRGAWEENWWSTSRRLSRPIEDCVGSRPWIEKIKIMLIITPTNRYIYIGWIILVGTDSSTVGWWTGQIPRVGQGDVPRRAIGEQTKGMPAQLKVLVGDGARAAAGLFSKRNGPIYAIFLK
jgi:hypothetical protein